MKPPIQPRRYPWALLLALAGASLLQARTFTSSDGRTLEGEVVAVGKDSFVLEDQKQKRITVPLAKVIQADKDFVADWKKANPVIKLEITAVKESGGKIEEKRASRKSENYHWKITVKNQTADPVTDLKLFYLQVIELRDFYATGGKKLVPLAKSADSLTIPVINAFGSVTLSTKDLKVSAVDYASTTTVEKWSESLAALNTEIYRGKRPVATFSQGSYAGMGTEKPKNWADEPEKDPAEPAPAPAEPEKTPDEPKPEDPAVKPSDPAKPMSDPTPPK